MGAACDESIVPERITKAMAKMDTAVMNFILVSKRWDGVSD